MIDSKSFFSTVLLALTTGCFSFDVMAENDSKQGLFDTVAVYAGQGANHNLRELPGRIASGQLEWDKSYFTGLGLSKTGSTLGQSSVSLRNSPIATIKQGYELVLLQHRGLQNNIEAGATYILRSPDFQMGAIGVNFASGAGLSYALGNPSYEDGSGDNPQRRYRLQLLALFEFEWHMRGLENLFLVTRVHHRSGVYGLIAPRHVGSNFLAAGLRYNY